MNNEIKKILKILKKCEFGACITKHNSRVLLDYITNLQEENKQLNGKIKMLENNCKQAEDSCRQHRLASKNHIRRLERREQQINIYKSRNKKAIEYITSEETINMFSSINAREKWLKINHKLLKILQGGDKDDK